MKNYLDIVFNFVCIYVCIAMIKGKHSTNDKF